MIEEYNSYVTRLVDEINSKYDPEIYSRGIQINKLEREIKELENEKAKIHGLFKKTK